MLLVSCKSGINLNGEFYELKDKEEIVSLKFINDSICIVKQKFLCQNLPEEFKEIEDIKVQYKKGRIDVAYLDLNKKKKKSKMDVLFVENLKYKNSNNLSITNYFSIPNYEKLKCNKLLENNSNANKIKSKIETGIIMNLVKDTIRIKKDTIFFGYKKVPRIR